MYSDGSELPVNLRSPTPRKDGRRGASRTASEKGDGGGSNTAPPGPHIEPAASAEHSDQNLQAQVSCEVLPEVLPIAADLITLQIDIIPLQ